MEKAILKTLIYGDIFDYPLTLREIHKWLIGKKVELRQIEKKYRVSSIEYRGKFHFLKGRSNIVRKRLQRQKQSRIYLRKAKIISWILKLIPWIKLVGISGGLSMENAGKKDDIDLILITSKNRLWISRLLALFILQLTGQRRKATHSIKQAAGKICLNILLEEDKLEQKKKNLYTAHEVLQMKVLWQRDGVYSKYLEDNSWAFKYLPNWMSQYGVSSIKYRGNKKTHGSIVDLLENLAKKIQLKIMQKIQGQERIEDGALYFHPKDYGYEVLTRYANLCKIHISFKLQRNN